MDINNTTAFVSWQPPSVKSPLLSCTGDYMCIIGMPFHAYHCMWMLSCSKLIPCYWYFWYFRFNDELLYCVASLCFLGNCFDSVCLGIETLQYFAGLPSMHLQAWNMPLFLEFGNTTCSKRKSLTRSLESHEIDFPTSLSYLHANRIVSNCHWSHINAGSCVVVGGLVYVRVINAGSQINARR